MAKKKSFKLDTTQLKQFLVAKGERVGLVAAAGLMVLLLLWGIMMGLGTGSDHAELQKIAQSKLGQVRIQDNEPPTPGKETSSEQNAKPKASWDPAESDKFPLTASFFDSGAITEDKVFNPYALTLVGTDKPLDEKAEYIKLDVVRAPVKVHTVTVDNMVEILKPSGGGADHVANDVKPHRMIVVSALFPYHDQLEVYKKFLRKGSLKEITSDEKLKPKFLGLDVVRCEVQGGQWLNFKKLFVYDPELKTLEVNPDWKSFLQTAKLDTKAYQKVKTYVVAGLATPMPELAEGAFPDYAIDAKGLKVAKGPPPKDGPGGIKDPMKPGLPGGLPDGSDTSKPAPGGSIEQISLADLEKTNKMLAKKLAGEFNIFEPFGEEKKPAAGPGGPGGVGPGGVGPGGVGPGGVGPGGVGDPPTGPGNPPKGPGMGDEKDMPDGPDAEYKGPENLLVRFVDPTVHPGKTYKYFIQVRLENPNFGKKDKVAYPALAEVKELFSGWTETPSKYVEEEYFYYVVDQFQLDPPKTNHPGTKDLDQSLSKKDELVAVQIHRWVEEGVVGETQLKEQKIGGWAVAERMLVKKGQYIGKEKAEVPLPYWKKTHEVFEIPTPKKGAKPKAVKAYPNIGVQDFNNMVVDLKPPSAPLVVDFKGGEAEYWYYLPGTTATVSNEKAAVQLLVLSPDGKLLSFNSRDDSEEKTPRGKQRLEHYQQWQAMLKGPAAKTAGDPKVK